MFDFWQDAKDNWTNNQKDKMRSLLLKYGGVLDEDEMDDADWFEYQAAKKYENEVRREMAGGAYVCPVKTNVYNLKYFVDKKIDEAENFIKNDALNYLPKTVQYAYDEAKRLSPIRMSDENKHQYVSCVAAQGGVLPAAVMLAGATLKEGGDIYKKITNSKLRKSYGGVAGVLSDSLKDMKSNLYGLGYGLTYPESGACNILQKKKIK